MIKILTPPKTQITFKTDLSLKESVLQKVRQQGITMKALLTTAMREYINGNLIFTIREQEDYHDPLFADPDIIEKANQFSALLIRHEGCMEPA